MLRAQAVIDAQSPTLGVGEHAMQPSMARRPSIWSPQGTPPEGGGGGSTRWAAIGPTTLGSCLTSLSVA
jgi:hypothetical protein